MDDPAHQDTDRRIMTVRDDIPRPLEIPFFDKRHKAIEQFPILPSLLPRPEYAPFYDNGQGQKRTEEEGVHDRPSLIKIIKHAYRSFLLLLP
jgi:hypothetical protein